MNKTKPKKFTFKNEARSKGLASVGEGTPSVNVKYAGVDVGLIHFNNHWHSNKELGICIQIKIPRTPTPDCSCPWKWVNITQAFASGDEAKAYLNNNFERISKMLYIEKE